MRVVSSALLVLASISVVFGINNSALGQHADVPLVVGRFGDLSTLQFVGNELFTTDEIRCALARDQKVQERCRPSAPLADLIEQLQQRLVEGYRHSGCPDAKVSVSPAEGECLVVRVEEGIRYLAGEIRVRGASTIDEASLSSSLIGPVTSLWSVQNVTFRQGGKVLGPVAADQPKPPVLPLAQPPGKQEKGEHEQTYWTAGVPIRFGLVSTDKMRPQVAEALLRQGYAEAKFRLELEPDAERGVVDLVIEVEDLGRPMTLENVTIEGLKRHTREQLLELMQIAEGQEFDVERLQQAIEEVRQSCRFWGCKLTVDFPSSSSARGGDRAGNGEGTRLAIEVVEYTHVAPLGEPLSEIDDILRRAGLWIHQFHTQREWDLEGEFIYPVGDVFGGTKVHVWLSPVEGIMLDLRLKGSPPKSNVILDGEYRLFAGAGGFAFADIGHGDWISTKIQAIAAPRLKLTEGEVESGDFKTTLNISFGTSSETETKDHLAIVHPVTLIDLAHSEGTKCEVKDGVLLLRENDRFEARFDVATGRLLHVELGQHEPKEMRIATVPRDPAGWRAREAEVAAYTSRWDSDRPLASLIDYAVDIATRATKEESAAANTKRAALRHLIESRPFAALERFCVDKWINQEPAIPVTAFQLPDSFKGHSEPKYSLAGLPDYLFVRETWPWTLTREATYFYSKRSIETQGADRQRELERVMARDDTGPICHWVLGKVGQTDRYTARQALEQFYDGTFAREIDMLTTPGTELWEMLEWLVPLAHSTTDEEIDKFVSTFADSFDRPVIQAAQFLRQLDATSTETLRDSFGRMLRDDLRPLIEADLRKLAVGGGRAERPALDFNQIGEPFPSEKEEQQEVKPE